MVELGDFDTDYWNPLDKDSLRAFQLTPKQTGISHGAGDVLQGLKSNIFAGANQVELGFIGMGKGSRSSPTGHTPESYGHDEREAMRQMAKVNDVKITTHASVGIGNLSGLGDRGFSPEQKEKSLMEVKRAIDFAADVAGGGPVTVHTGEFPRSIQESFGKGEFKFREYEGEEERKVHYLVDNKTGQISKAVREDEYIDIPIKKIKDGEAVRIKSPYSDSYEDVYETDKEGNLQFETLKFKDWRKKYCPNKSGSEAAIEFNKELQRAEIQHAEGQANEYEYQYKQSTEKAEKIDTALKVYKNNYEKAKNDEERKAAGYQAVAMLGISPSELHGEDPKRFLDEQKMDTLKRLRYSQEIGLSSRKQAMRAQRSLDSTERIEDYGLKQSADSIAKAAIYAYEREKAQKLDKHLFIAPENIFPEGGYGSHPDELKNLVNKSRDQMTKLLVEQKKMSESQAKEIADNHIKATFDVGHAYTWKKFFERKEGETAEQADKRFNKWMLDKVEDLQKKGIIGHVHISDNFGYYDEHVTPGEGNAPIKEAIGRLKKAGYTGDVIAEVGGQPEGQMFNAMTGLWRTAHSPMYRIDSTSTSWTDIDNSYFGRTGSPGYLVGKSAPSKDWAFWSETPLE